MPYQTVNDIQLYYEIKGHGAPLVFLSGFSSHHYNWRFFADAFSSSYQTIVLDHRGAGKSSVPPPPYTIETLSRDVIALLDTLNIAKITLIGSSMGAAVALAMALEHPTRVEKGALISPFAQLPKTSLMNLRALGQLIQNHCSRDLIADLAFPWLFSSAFLSNQERAAAKKKDFLANPYPQALEGYFGQLAALEAFDLRSSLSHISQPFLLLSGAEDLSSPPRCSKLLSSQLPKNQLHTFPNVGHMVHVERRIEVIDLISSFLTA